MNTAVMFSKASDEYETPKAIFDALHEEFDFLIDVAATRENRKCPVHCGPGSRFGEDGLDYPWALLLENTTGAAWCNPPYSRCSEFMAKAAEEAKKGCTVVALVPARTDTSWFHATVYDAATHGWRPGVEVRFVKGRLKFGSSNNSAPFPSVVIVFRPLRVPDAPERVVVVD